MSDTRSADEIPIAYVPDEPRRRETPESTGARWRFPERQPGAEGRERRRSARRPAGGSRPRRRAALRSFASLHPDNPLTETGVLAELTADGTSRAGRSDRRHHLLDPLIVAGPWVAGAGAAVLGVRRLRRRARSR